MKSRLKKGCVLLFLLSMFSAMMVSAQELPKPTEMTGSITISLEDTEHKNPKDHVVFRVTKIADVVDGRYVIKEDYQKAGVDLNALKTANDMEEACKKLEPLVKKEMEVVTNQEGEAVLKDLPMGVYFIHAADIAKYEEMLSFLVSIPTWNEADKVMEYDVKAIPKHTEVTKTNLPETTNPPKTGDDADARFWIAISIGSMLLIVITSSLYCCVKAGKKGEEQLKKVYKKKEKNNDE